MTILLSNEQTKIHERALDCGRSHRGAEAELVLALQEIGRSGLWRRFDRRSPFAYAVGELGLTDSVAATSIAVARAAALVPELQEAIVSRRMSVSLASRIVQRLSPENAAEVIAYVLSHTCREVDWECARRNPRPDAGDGAKPTAGKRIKVAVTPSRETYEKLRRVESLEAQCGRAAGLERAVEAAVEEYLERRDPAPKAAAAPASGKPRTYRDQQILSKKDGAGPVDGRAEARGPCPVRRQLAPTSAKPASAARPTAGSTFTTYIR